MTTAIRLAPLVQSDSPTLFAWINDRELVLYNAPYRPVGEAAHRQWFENVQSRRDCVLFGIRLLEDDRLIGTCQLNTIDPLHRSASLQIRIGDTAMRDRGLGTEAVRLLLRHGFVDLNLHRIELSVFGDNPRARRAYEKAGFVAEGKRRQAAWIDGAYRDLELMAILRSEWRDGDAR